MDILGKLNMIISVQKRQMEIEMYGEPLNCLAMKQRLQLLLKESEEAKKNDPIRDPSLLKPKQPTCLEEEK